MKVDHVAANSTASKEINPNVLHVQPPGQEEVLRIGPDGRIFWRQKEVETDDQLREAMLDLRNALLLITQPHSSNAMLKNAERYQKLRAMHWSESPMCVVVNPKESVKLGHDCPCGDRLDEMLDNL